MRESPLIFHFCLFNICLVKINMVCLRVNESPNDTSFRVNIFDSGDALCAPCLTKENCEEQSQWINRGEKVGFGFYRETKQSVRSMCMVSVHHDVTKGTVPRGLSICVTMVTVQVYRQINKVNTTDFRCGHVCSKKDGEKGAKHEDCIASLAVQIRSERLCREGTLQDPGLS